MKNSNCWKIFFRFAALFNFIAATFLLFAPDLLYQLLFIEERIQANAYLYLDLFAMLVYVFGWGYWRISIDPVKNSDIIRMGIIGKTAVFAIAWYHYLLFDGPLGFALLVILDLIFAVIFTFYTFNELEPS